jgi:glucose-6-phosphate isomerase, archaeal
MISASIFDVRVRPDKLAFQYGAGVTGPAAEFRSLDAIRPSLLDSHCSGPDPVCGIAMDVARECDLPELRERMLLYGVVAFAAGRLGQEPVRSQGHVHAVAPHCGWSTPELFEIIEGRAIVYSQETTEDDPGCCIAVVAEEGDKVVVAPGWAHCVINADPGRRMVFGAWCDRQYGFVYDGVRRHGGLAWFPILTASNEIEWRPNTAYHTGKIAIHPARQYPELGILPNGSIYEQFVRDPDSIGWVSNPANRADVWAEFRS